MHRASSLLYTFLPNKTCNKTLRAATIYNVSESQDELYREATAAYGDALDRLVRAYELDLERRRDLLQDIHLALWRSFEKFEARCSLRTWVYRIAHNIATSYVIRQRRANSWGRLTLEKIESMPNPGDEIRETHDRLDCERLLQLIHRLKPLDREV